jgi:hypothetical protein
VRKTGSENTYGCTQNAKNCFGFEFLGRYHKDGGEFLNHIALVGRDETGVSFLNVETKSRQSSGCTHIYQTRRKSLNKRCLPARKLIKTVFWNRKGVLMVGFMQQGTTITSEVYFETL